jgi:2'-hydroxyisoflavone reductase
VRVLIVGGTRFLGRHLAELALAAGHELTLVHRGRSGPGLFAQARHLLLDRNGDLSALASALESAGPWDAAIDTSGYVPRHVRSLAEALAGRVAHYQFVSSISVYASMKEGATTEEAAVATITDPTVEAVTGETYGALKALCEQAARASFGEPRTLVVRPGLIVGPHDPSGRFTWWVRRLMRGGEVLAPGDPGLPVQFIDARDLAAWMLVHAERATSGTFNLTGPVQPLTMGGFLEAARAVLAPAGCTLTWVDEALLLAQRVAPWSDLPVWLNAEEAGLHRTDISRALGSGLYCRPLELTLADTAAWAREADELKPGSPAPGLAPEREARLLDLARTSGAVRASWP